MTRYLALMIACVPVGAAAQTLPGDKPQTTEERAKGVATMPAEDINLKKRQIPPQLQAIQADPYSLTGVKTCRQIGTAIEDLDAVLGPDVDSEAAPDDMDAGDGAVVVAREVVKGFIPFRGVIREVSGANKAQRQYETALYAGLVRRGFLKGYGRAKGCEPPIAPKS